MNNSIEVYGDMSPNLNEQLLKSDAIASLAGELAVAATLRELRWNVVHGFFYLDSVSGKYRELDVAAHRNGMQYASGSKDYDLVDVELLVECKTARDSNIIIVDPGYNDDWFDEHGCFLTPPELSNPLVDRDFHQLIIADLAHHFAGSSVEEKYKKLWKAVEKFFVAQKDDLVLRGLRDYQVDPPATRTVSTTFREAAGVREKDLDISTLWRAFQSVHSALAAEKESYLKTVRWRIAQGIKEDIFSRDLDSAFVSVLTDLAGHIKIYHPLIVTQSRLWSLQGGVLSNVGTFRLWQVDSVGAPVRWADVVNAEEFAQFAKERSDHYGHQRGFHADANPRKPGVAASLRPYLKYT